MKILITLLLLITSFFALNIAPINYKGKVDLIKQINFNPNFGSYNFSEISGLAYDKKRKILYMVSDKGIMFTFKANFNDDNFTLKPLKAVYFKKRNGKRYKKHYHDRDTEGIALDDKGNIYVSREGRLRVTQFSPNGIKIKNLKLPTKLRKIREKDLQSGNKGLESLTWHPKYGLITALELPIQGKKLRNQTIYSFNGKTWKLKMEPYKNNSISDIEVMDDGNLLILERAYGGILGKFVVTLKELYIKGCKKEPCKSETLLSIDSSKGWKIENFEGIASVGNNRYLMVNDNNNIFFKKTKLIYFKVGR